MDQTPPEQALVIIAQYIKDFSFENPNAPGIYSALSQKAPEINIDVDVVRENAETVLNSTRGTPLVEQWLLAVVAEADVTVEPEYGSWVASPVPQVTPPA